MLTFGPPLVSPAQLPARNIPARVDLPQANENTLMIISGYERRNNHPQRLGEPRLRRRAKYSSLYQMTADYQEMIPPAVDEVAMVEWEDDSEKVIKTKRFSRLSRMRAFYFLLALADKKKPVQAKPFVACAGDEQIERMVKILDAVEDIATEKIDRVQRESLKSAHYVEDPVLMRVYVENSQTLKLDNGYLQAAPSVKESYSKFSAKNHIIVIPSTREYTLVDVDGRILVIRIQKPINYPYEHMLFHHVQWAIRNGTVIFNLPKQGMDLLGKPLQATYIHPLWQSQQVMLTRTISHII